MSDGKSAYYINIHGRRWGRGARPYLLVLKWLGVSAFLGGLMTVLTLMFLGPAASSPDAWPQQADLLRGAFRMVIVPGVNLAVLAGILLLASVWRALIRMRWFQIKAALIVTGLPSLHFWMHSRSHAFQAAVADPDTLPGAAVIRHQLLVGILAALALGMLLVILGRIKPRLGQGYAGVGNVSTPKQR